MKRAEFTRTTMLAAWDRCCGPDGVHRCECDNCGGTDNTEGLPILPGKRPEYDHWIEAELGGDASLGNCRCVIAEHHRAKTSARAKVLAKCRRVRAAHAGAKTKPKRRIPYRRFNGESVWK